MNPFPKRKNYSILLFIFLSLSILNSACSKIGDANTIPTNSFTGSMVISPPSDVTILKNDDVLGENTKISDKTISIPFGDLEFAEVILDLREVQFQKEDGGIINIIPSIGHTNWIRKKFYNGTRK